MKPIGIAAVLAVVVVSHQPAWAQVSVVSDAAAFDAALGPSTEIDFEDLPYDGSSCGFDFLDTPIPNPLVIDGVVFTDSHCLQTGFCSSPTCTADPDNRWGGNVVVFLNPGGTIDLPAGTSGALLVIEGIGSATFTLRATDNAGNAVETLGQGVIFGTVVRGFTSPSGIARIELIGTSGGPIVVTTLFVAKAATVPSLIAALDTNIATLATAGVLTAGQSNALRVKLAAALKSVNEGYTRAANHQLSAFLNQVDALVSAGILSSAHSAELAAAVADIRARLP